MALASLLSKRGKAVRQTDGQDSEKRPRQSHLFPMLPRGRLGFGFLFKGIIDRGE